MVYYDDRYGFNAKCERTLVVYTHGECNTAASQAAAAVRFEDGYYVDCDASELVPQSLQPFTAPLVGFWAIVRALARAPWLSNLTILTGNEVCVSTLDLCLEKGKDKHTHSHPELVDRILQDVASRRKAGCTVRFEFIGPTADTTSVKDGPYIPANALMQVNDTPWHTHHTLKSAAQQCSATAKGIEQLSAFDQLSCAGASTREV